MNALFEFYVKNNVLYKDLKEDENLKTIISLTEKDIQDMTIVHNINEGEASLNIYEMIQAILEGQRYLNLFSIPKKNSSSSKTALCSHPLKMLNQAQRYN